MVVCLLCCVALVSQPVSPGAALVSSVSFVVSQFRLFWGVGAQGSAQVDSLRRGATGALLSPRPEEPLKNHNKCLLPSSLLLSLGALTIAQQLTSVMVVFLVHFAFAEALTLFMRYREGSQETHQRPGFPLRPSICRGVARPLCRSAPL